MEVDSNAALIILAFVFLPGTIASRTFANVSRMRGGGPEVRSSVLLWSAIIGGINLPALPLLKGATAFVLEKDDSVWVDVLWAPVFALVVPFVVGLGAGWGLPKLKQKWRQNVGLGSDTELMPWDSLSLGHRGAFWFSFSYQDIQYRAYTEEADRDLEQIWLTRVSRWDGKEWVPEPSRTALRLKDGSLIWMDHPDGHPVLPEIPEPEETKETEEG